MLKSQHIRGLGYRRSYKIALKQWFLKLLDGLRFWYVTREL